METGSSQYLVEKFISIDQSMRINERKALTVHDSDKVLLLLHTPACLRPPLVRWLGPKLDPLTCLGIFHIQTPFHQHATTSNIASLDSFFVWECASNSAGSYDFHFYTFLYIIQTPSKTHVPCLIKKIISLTSPTWQWNAICCMFGLSISTLRQSPHNSVKDTHMLLVF